MTARDEVLAAVRAAVAGTAPVDVPRGYRQHDDRPVEELLDLLTDRLLDYKASVRRVAAAGLADAVAEALGDARTCVVPADLDDGWSAAWTTAGGRLVVDDRLDVAALDEVDAVLTGARVAIAETGTIVLDGGPGTGRRAISLVPDHHVCVLHAADVVASVPLALTRLDPARPLTWISGPSATSDIELDRVEGVHGPRRLDVVLVAP
ncbi:MAG: lactate utilization protein C [Actinomycetes bacterium]